MKKRNVLNSPRLLALKRRKRRTVLSKILLLLVVLLAILGSLAYIFRIPSLNIKSVEIDGTRVIDADTIRANIEKEIAGNYLWILPKTNIFLYPKSKIKEELSKSFKRLKNIDVSTLNNTVLKVTVFEREAKYLWCETEEKCYFMDGDGFIFDEAPYFSGEVYFRFYGSSNGDFVKLFPFKKIIEDMGLKPIGLSILENSNVEMFLSGKSKPKIIFNATSDFQKIAENLQAALATEPLRSDFKNKYSSLLYLDLRYGNKVY
ncbi:MAG: hypothetical protein UU07_C0004G0017, partial [Parcubacteria group bacterium GW2011_GWF1_40_5]